MFILQKNSHFYRKVNKNANITKERQKDRRIQIYIIEMIRLKLRSYFYDLLKKDSFPDIPNSFFARKKVGIVKSPSA